MDTPGNPHAWHTFFHDHPLAQADLVRATVTGPSHGASTSRPAQHPPVEPRDPHWLGEMLNPDDIAHPGW